MAKICVEIEMDTDTGAISVYECEPEPPEMRQGEQRFEDMESALQAAAQILGGEQSGMSEMQSAMSSGYDRVAGKRAPATAAGNQYQEM